jgi:hypothetical protein
MVHFPRKFLLLFVTSSLSLKTLHAETILDKKSWATYDTQAAFDIIGGHHTIGNCDIEVELEDRTEDRKHLRVKLTHSDPTRPVFQFEQTFSNYQSNLSSVSVSRAYLGFGAAHTVSLERVDPSEIPATKFILNFIIEDDQPASLNFVAARGYAWNVVRDFDCGKE